MSIQIYLNGQYVSKEEASVSVFDHGFLYGDGIFEGIRSYGGNVFRLKEHIERLYDSAKSIMLDIPMSPEKFEEVICETIRKNNLTDSYIRVVVSRGKGDLGLCPTKCPKPTVIVIADSISIYPKELYEKGLRTITVPTRRNNPDALNPKIKSLNYLNNVLVKIEANQAGVSEAIMLNHQGYVAEGSADNIFVIRKGKIVTPPTYLGALEGITRQAIMDIANELGYPMVEEPFTRHDVYIADEVFLTGTAAEVIPVIEVDGRVIGSGEPGPITKKLLEEFRKITYTDGTKI
ncbi:branched-chain-amino-acid transaminase [Desulfuribacillus alkaliarsenatis]|uniref:Branched-chain-amino-acid aminotransferase n=1 Tax=Desulfuribacillus alkaliarsenatis TaxID=766136 RepID=A0A1E5FYM8_9FIRM|nr:branched-chain-amino-acid transaminase [Desulfuribacillus alkaliarsenatis]OEF95670.1 branched-chain-amino-acid transaminase [Desulfuribacillus alkaliarsenatis]